MESLAVVPAAAATAAENSNGIGFSDVKFFTYYVANVVSLNIFGTTLIGADSTYLYSRENDEQTDEHARNDKPINIELDNKAFEEDHENCEDIFDTIDKEKIGKALEISDYDTADEEVNKTIKLEIQDLPDSGKTSLSKENEYENNDVKKTLDLESSTANRDKEIDPVFGSNADFKDLKRDEIDNNSDGYFSDSDKEDEATKHEKRNLPETSPKADLTTNVEFENISLTDIDTNSAQDALELLDKETQDQKEKLDDVIILDQPRTNYELRKTEKNEEIRVHIPKSEESHGCCLLCTTQRKPRITTNSINNISVQKEFTEESANAADASVTPEEDDIDAQMVAAKSSGIVDVFSRCFNPKRKRRWWF